MNVLKENLIALHECPQVTRSLLRKILNVNDLLPSLRQITPEQFAKAIHIPISRSSKIYQFITNPYIMKKLDKNRIHYHYITYFDRQYPPSLRTIPDPPLMLYALGNIQHLHTPLNLSVVGTRTPSHYAFSAMNKILPPLVQAHFTIVSGMAMGVDQHSHKIAIEHDGKTIAVIGSGFHHLYPKNDQQLFDKLAENHIIISEYPPDQPPKKYHFPERNRIISGLSEATLVIEARMRSGSLITVDQALEQGRDIYAIPGPVGALTSEGCHHIIQQGAKLVQSYEDILEGYCEKN
ncbi:DNA processing protein DprA [Halobacillus andaensis]|uniref:DNA processing protein DprA n=1 Tax=Halobacillus andaensis TaxID=1176239 RepID=A0A917ETF9_HALAA|nr:DNA-processing protein DprA [Halobacillus andaensis]MBP2003506.1 DNA processing protein [Halobacillus andaensis]GGF11152.1 DNA processing protein DprA [Halobacillus andaensis]